MIRMITGTEVRIFATGNIGLVVGHQLDLTGQIWYIVRIGRKDYPFKIEDFTDKIYKSNRKK